MKFPYFEYCFLKNFESRIFLSEYESFFSAPRASVQAKAINRRIRI